jgi:short-subunit dehydrogenase
MIGSLVGSWMAKQQVTNILLLGRSGRPGTDAGGVIELVAGGGSSAAVHMVRCDAASAEEVAAVAAAATTGGQRLQGVVHSGGVLADATIPNQSLPGIRFAFAPKASSAQLWQLPVGMQPAALHLTFSSVAALLGSPGQANYSAANAALDCLAQGWQAQVSLNCLLAWAAVPSGTNNQSRV